MKEVTLTFKQWTSLGYGVLKGEKSKSINDEFEATFTRKQVDKYDSYSYEDSQEIGDFYRDCMVDIGSIY